MPDGGHQTTVFLSYAHADQARARAVAFALEQCGYQVWWDQLIEGGSRFASSIDEALEKADAIVVLWSKHSVHSDWVRDEASIARDRQRFIPLSLDGELPPLGFRQYQAIDLSHWRGKTDAEQVEALRRAISLAMGEHRERATKVAKPVDRRRVLIAGGVFAAAAGGAAVWSTGLLGPDRAHARSIAVLPFKNLSGDPGQAFLSDGLTEEVRAAIARNLGLMVLAATTSNSVKNDSGDARSIASKLGVSYLLDGSVQRAGDRVRVAINLTNGRTGFSEWSQRVERRLEDIFAFQSEIAQAVWKALSIRIATDAPVTGGTRNPGAYEAYLRGKALYNLAKDEESDRQAKANYELALAADPSFALAHAALSRVLASLVSEGATSDPKATYRTAIAEAERAIQLAPTLAEGHLALGYARFAGFLDVRGARSSYEKAYRYGRGDADIVLLYALYVVRALRFAEARDAIERALALDPLNPRTHRAAGLIAYASRRFDESIAAYRRALQLNPNISNANAFIGNALMLTNRLREARAAIVAEKSGMFRLTSLAILELRERNAVAATQAYNQLVGDFGDSALYQQAEVMAQWGKGSEALALLRRAHAVGDPGLTGIASDPMLDPISRNPQFIQFCKGLGFA